LLEDPKIKGVKSQYKDEVENLVSQKANNQILGLPLAPQVYLHEYGLKKYDKDKYQEQIEKIEAKYERKIEKTDKKKKREKLLGKKNEKIDKLRTKIETGNWWMRNFEKLAVFDSAEHMNSKDQINQYLNTKGFFRNQVDVDFKDKSSRKTIVTYNVTMGPAYTIDSITYTIPDPQIDSLRKATSENSLIEKGMQYDQKTLESERDRLYDLYANNGYFTFSRQYISYELDTNTLADQKILVNEVISNPSGERGHQVFKVDSIVLTTESTTQGGQRFNITNYEDITYRFGRTKYNPKILDWRLFIREDSLYSRANTLETQRQLSYLDAFKFVNINYDSVGTDLIANIFTSPLDRFQTATEVGFVVDASQQLPGPFANFSLKNRNTFGGLELIELRGNFSLQGIQNVVSETDENTRNYSLFQYGGRLSITLPQFFFPASTSFKRKISAYNPRTQFSIGYNYEDRVREYEREIFNTTYSYIFSFKENNRYTFTPLSLSYTNVVETTNDFEEFLQQQELQGNGALAAAFQSSFISNSSFEAIFNQDQYGSSNGSGSLLRLFVESGGLLTSLIGRETLQGLQRNPNGDDELATFKWLKLNADYRKTVVKNKKTTYAYRVNFGIAHPYGEDLTVPYEKRFYIGGSNSIRAWPIRRLGPGAYGINANSTSTGEIDQIDYRLEQGGDLILETSFEVRKPLAGFVDYAFFIDAGNIWLLNSDVNIEDEEGDTGKFSVGSFLTEMAVGVGFGLRFDFSFLVFRLDGAVQMHDPAQEKGDRLILRNLQEINPFGTTEQKQNFRNKSALNIGIGFPF
jgi:outer membrane protein assembly factor BamA